MDDGRSRRCLSVKEMRSGKAHADRENDEEPAGRGVCREGGGDEVEEQSHSGSFFFCPFLSSSLFLVFQDALELLGLKEMRSGKAQADTEAEEETSAGGAEGGAGTEEGAKARVVTQLKRHQLVEGTIPIMIELKQ